MPNVITSGQTESESINPMITISNLLINSYLGFVNLGHFDRISDHIKHLSLIYQNQNKIIFTWRRSRLRRHISRLRQGRSFLVGPPEPGRRGRLDLGHDAGVVLEEVGRGRVHDADS
jgi:hypothetical protein